MDTKRRPTARRRSRRRAALILGLLAVIFMTIGSLAAFNEAFVLDWWTVTSGGTMTGGALMMMP